MIGFIGVGSMGGAIARGLVASGIRGSSLVVTSKSPERREALAAELGAAAMASSVDVVEAAGQGGLVVLAVKPYAVRGVLDAIREEAQRQGTVIISVAAGISLATMAEHLAPGQPIVRTMPNVAAAVGESMTAMSPNAAAEPHADRVREVLESFGQVAEIAEQHFAIFSALAGCSPAYTFEYIDSLSRAGVRNGLTKAAATRIAAQAVYGAAKLLLDRMDDGETAASLADSVQSPGGTTVAGVVELEQAGFGAAIVRGVQASVERDAQLG